MPFGGLAFQDERHANGAGRQDGRQHGKAVVLTQSVRLLGPRAVLCRFAAENEQVGPQIHHEA
jgi:hypothetical protein